LKHFCMGGGNRYTKAAWWPGNNRVGFGRRPRPFTSGKAMSTLPSLVVTLDGPS
jgi:hypothetical protein